MTPLYCLSANPNTTPEMLSYVYSLWPEAAKETDLEVREPALP